MTRLCRYCGEPLARERRKGTRYCDDLCRSRKHRGIAPETVGHGSRRPSRNGRGVRPYILPEDGSQEILAKVEAARGRRR
jgi:hypothetical protein